MKRFLALTLAVALVLVGMPAPLAAAAGRPAGGTISGIATESGGRLLPNYTVRLRSVPAGQIVVTTQTGPGGEFAFTDIPAGDYVVEIVDGNGKIQGISRSLKLAPGGALSGVGVSVPAGGAIAGAATAGHSFFTSTSGLLLLAAAGAGVGVGVAAGKGRGRGRGNNPSPSK